MRKPLVLGVVLLLLALTGGTPLLAQPSLDPGHWDTLTVKDQFNRQDTITIIKDFKKPTQWYYVPNRPRLAENTYVEEDASGTQKVTVTKPIFQLMTLQTKDKSKKNIYEEGMLQFSLRMDLHPSAASQAAKLLFEKLKAEKLATEPKDVRLLPLPITSATVSIYEPSGKWMSDGAKMPGIAPLFSTQSVPFQLNLTSFGADAMKALTTKGQAGLGVYYEMEFEGMTPPAGFKITVDWSQTHKHFSENTKEKEYWNALLFAGGSSSSDKTKVRESLEKSKCIKIESTTSKEVPDEVIDNYIDKLLERINKELIEDMKPPAEIPVAQASDPGCSPGIFYSKNTSYAMKDIEKTRKGTEVITFDRSSLITRRTACGTFIGIGNYSDEVKKEAIIVMEPGKWEKSFFPLPAVGDNPDLGIQLIELSCYVVYKKDSKKAEGSYPSFSGCENPQLVMWKPAEPTLWRDKDGDVVPNISWPLQALYAEAEAAKVDIAKYAEYKIELKITSKGNMGTLETLKMSYNQPMITGDSPVANPLELVDPLFIDGRYLTWGDKKKGLKNVNISIVSKNPPKTMRATFLPATPQKNFACWLLPRLQPGAANSVIPDIQFFLYGKNAAGQPKVAWSDNGQDLLESNNTSIVLDDYAYDPDGEFIQ